MAGAGAPPNYDDVGEYDVRRHGTPPRYPPGGGEEDLDLLAAQTGLTGQPAGGGGVISINHTNMVANTLREEMHAVRSDLEAKFNAMKIEFEIKMSGRKGTGHYESGAIDTLIENTSSNRRWRTSRKTWSVSRISSATTRTSLA